MEHNNKTRFTFLEMDHSAQSSDDGAKFINSLI